MRPAPGPERIGYDAPVLFVQLLLIAPTIVGAIDPAQVPSDLIAKNNTMQKAIPKYQRSAIDPGGQTQLQQILHDSEDVASSLHGIQNKLSKQLKASKKLAKVSAKNVDHMTDAEVAKLLKMWHGDVDPEKKRKMEKLMLKKNWDGFGWFSEAAVDLAKKLSMQKRLLNTAREAEVMDEKALRKANDAEVMRKQVVNPMFNGAQDDRVKDKENHGSTAKNNVGAASMAEKTITNTSMEEKYASEDEAEDENEADDAEDVEDDEEEEEDEDLDEQGHENKYEEQFTEDFDMDDSDDEEDAFRSDREILAAQVVLRPVLPNWAKWCRVTPCDGQSSFWIATYAHNDPVSDEICKNGKLELCSAFEFGPSATPSNSPLALDVGGHIGYFTLLLANAKWKVVLVEPLPSNTLLIRASLLANPDLMKNIRLHELALGTNPGQTCAVMSDAIEEKSGSGHVFCARNNSKVMSWVTSETHRGHTPLGYFGTSTLNMLLKNEPWTNDKRIDLMKINVKGYEDQVMKGGSLLLDKYRPHRIESQVWGKSKDKSTNWKAPQAFLQSFVDAGYTIGHQFQCQSSQKIQVVGISAHEQVSLPKLHTLLQNHEADVRMCLTAKAIRKAAASMPVAQVEGQDAKRGGAVHPPKIPVHPRSYFPSPLLHDNETLKQAA